MPQYTTPSFQGWTYHHFWRRRYLQRDNWHLTGCWWAVLVKGLNFRPGRDCGGGVPSSGKAESLFSIATLKDGSNGNEASLFFCIFFLSLFCGRKVKGWLIWVLYMMDWFQWFTSYSELASPLGKTDSLTGVAFHCLLSSASASTATCCTSSVCFLPGSCRSPRLQHFQLDLVQSRATLPLMEVRTSLSECQMHTSFCWLCDWEEGDTLKK